MSVITPKDLSGNRFSTSFKGYNKAEVDEYINKVLKNYSFLYRRCAELEEQTAVAKLRLENVDNREKAAKKTLDDAKEKSEKMIAEAYARADEILVAIKKNCDSVLRDFRDKVDTQKDALAEMNARVELFKNDLFTKYKQHIELLEKLSPAFDYEEELSANEYVARVIAELKHEITAEYDIAVGYDDGSEHDVMYDGRDELPTEEEISAFINDLTKKNIIDEHDDTQNESGREQKAASEDEAENKYTRELAEKEEEKTVSPNISATDAQLDSETKLEKMPISEDEVAQKTTSPSHIRSTKKRKKQLATVLEMLREYDEQDVLDIPKIETQFMLDLDSATDSLVEIKHNKQQ